MRLPREHSPHLSLWLLSFCDLRVWHSAPRPLPASPPCGCSRQEAVAGRAFAPGPSSVPGAQTRSLTPRRLPVPGRTVRSVTAPMALVSRLFHSPCPRTGFVTLPFALALDTHEKPKIPDHIVICVYMTVSCGLAFTFIRLMYHKL